MIGLVLAATMVTARPTAHAKPALMVLSADLGRINADGASMTSRFRYVEGSNTAVFTSWPQEQAANLTGVTVVVIDLEAWQRTPVAEQHHFLPYARLMVRRAHQFGALAVVAPGRDLGGGTDGYLADRYPALAAKAGADVLEVQAQDLEGPHNGYAWLVQQAAAQARAVSPHIAIWAGIGTDHGAPAYSAHLMEKAYASVRGLASGFWLNAAPWAGGPGCEPQGCPQAARIFLNWLG